MRSVCAGMRFWKRAGESARQATMSTARMGRWVAGVQRMKARILTPGEVYPDNGRSHALAQSHQPPACLESRRHDFIDVDAGGNELSSIVFSVPRYLLRPGFHAPIHQPSHLPARHVDYPKRDGACFCKYERKAGRSTR